MILHVVHLNCVPAPASVDLSALLDRWPTLRDIADATSAAGVTVTVLQASARRETLQRGAIIYHAAPELLPPSWRDPLWRRGAALVRRLGPDMIHLNGLDFPRQTQALRATGIPILVQDHASRAGGRAGALRRWGLRGIAGTAFTARDQAEPFRHSGQLSPQVPVFTIPESSSHFTAGPRDAARHATGVTGMPALLWVGHLDGNKDPLTVLAAVRIALDALPDLQLWCAYRTAPLIGEVKAMLARDSQLAAHVHLLGPVPRAEIEMLCRACDGFVSASRREGSGYALIEALACGLVPVVSDIPSFRALLGNRVGALVPPADPAAMAQALVRLFTGSNGTDAARRDSVRSHFDAHLSFARVGAQLVSAYRTIVDREDRR